MASSFLDGFLIVYSSFEDHHTLFVLCSRPNLLPSLTTVSRFERTESTSPPTVPSSEYDTLESETRLLVCSRITRQNSIGSSGSPCCIPPADLRSYSPYRSFDGRLKVCHMKEEYSSNQLWKHMTPDSVECVLDVKF